MKELVFSEMWKQRQLDNFEGEIWKPCTESLYYEISNYGRVKQIGSITKSNKPIPRITPQRLDSKGYCVVNLITNNSKACKGFRVHRLVGFCFISNDKDLEQINHINGIKTFNFVKNLEWMSNTENMRHSYRIGLRKDSSKGEMNGRSVLTEKDVIRIYENEELKSISEYVEIYNISRSVIQNIYNGKLWKYITLNLKKRFVWGYHKYSKCIKENQVLIFNDRKTLSNFFNCRTSKFKNLNKEYNIDGYDIKFISAKEYYDIFYENS